MKILVVLLLLALSLNIVAGFAQVAAALQRSGSAWADTVGFTGIGIAAVVWIASSVFVCRRI
jgi:hypothetical protein